MNEPTAVGDAVIRRMDALDDAWRRHRPIPLRRLLDQADHWPPTALRDLIVADLEWRWRAWPPSRDVSATPDSDDDFADNEPKWSEQYWRAFPDLFSSDADKLDLAEVEFMARSRRSLDQVELQNISRKVTMMIGDRPIPPGGDAGALHPHGRRHRQDSSRNRAAGLTFFVLRSSFFVRRSSLFVVA